MKGAAALLALALLPAAAPAAPRPVTAVVLSAGATLLPCAAGTVLFVSDEPEVGWALTAGGVLLGPAAGYVYGGLPGRGLAGVGVRAGLATIGLLGAGAMFDETNDSRAGAIVALVAAAGLAVVTAGDLGLVGPEVRENNRQRAVSLVPWRSREGAPGLALRAAF